MFKFFLKKKYVLGKALTGELSCPVTGLVFVASGLTLIAD